ncbi:MAG: FAD-dependent monooxygenase [Rhodospirillaceae bacterium]
MFKDPVVIVGAGPVGCVLAYALAKNGIPSVLLEQESDLREDLRASTFHPPTLDMLDDLDLVEELLSLGLICPKFQFRDRRTERYAEFDLDVLKEETQHPYRAQVEQFRLTRLICERLKREPLIDVLFGHKVIQVDQEDICVRLEIETSEGLKRLSASYVVGTDGGPSIVRRSAHIDFPGFTYPEKFIVVSTAYPLENHLKGLSYVNYIADPGEWMTIIRCNNLWRLSVPADPSQSDDALLQESNVQRIMRDLTQTQDPIEIAHRNIYAVNQRVAETYRKGRVLLAGDAAHVNNPLGGMGMNGGIHDAVNLGEKLVAIRDGANDSVLDVYDRQRRIVATKFVQEQSIRNKEDLENKDKAQHEAKLLHLMDVAADPALAKDYLLSSSMINVVRESYSID